jgi:hypothetical protein
MTGHIADGVVFATGNACLIASHNCGVDPGQAAPSSSSDSTAPTGAVSEPLVVHA